MAVVDLVTVRVVEDTLRVSIGRASAGTKEGPRGQQSSLEDGVYARLVDGVALSVRAALELKPTGVVVDVREALTVWGPMSVEALGRLLNLLGVVRVPTAVVIGEEPLHQLQLSRLITERGGGSMAIVRSDDEARMALRAASSDRWAVSTGIRRQALFGDLRFEGFLPKKAK